MMQEARWIVGTGLSRGIGFELLKKLKQNQFHVIHLGRKKTGLEDEFIPWNLEIPMGKNQMDLLQSQLEKRHHITGFFYGAGMMPPLDISSPSLSSANAFWLAQEQAMRVNYFSCAELVEMILPFMGMDSRFRGNDKEFCGNDNNRYENDIPFVAHLSSLAAVDPFPGLELYGATKSAALSYFSWLSKRFDSDELNCLSIHPGTVETDMTLDIMKKESPDLEIVKVFQKLMQEKKLMTAKESAEKIFSFLFKENSGQRQKAHGNLYVADQNKIL